MAAKKKAAAKTGMRAKAVEETPPLAPEGSTGEAEGVRHVDQTYEIRSVTQIKVHPSNWNKGAREAIAESIDANGFYGAVLVQKSTNLILAGNHRYEEAKAKGFQTIPCIVIDCSDEEASRIMGSDNRTSRLGTDDQKKLHSMMEQWKTTEMGLRGTGYAETDYLKLAAKMGPPVERIPEFTDTVRHAYQCPSCGHEWASKK